MVIIFVDPMVFSHYLVKIRNFTLFYDPPKHGHSEHFEHLQKICSSNGLEDTTMLEVALLMKRGVVIFGLFAADRDFGTYPKLFPWDHITL